jgi:hypothetical protein
MNVDYCTELEVCGLVTLDRISRTTVRFKSKYFCIEDLFWFDSVHVVRDRYQPVLVLLVTGGHIHLARLPCYMSRMAVM